MPPSVAGDEQSSLAANFSAQVDAYYALPRKRSPRTEIVFSPSGVTKCARELYYMHTDAPQDDEPRIPWRERLPRNGEAVHTATQRDYLEMEQKLRAAGLPVKFRFLEAEISGERSYVVDGYKVTIRGRCDGRIGVLDAGGSVIEEIIWEKKTKDGRTKLNKIAKSGQPQPEHRSQAVAYALIFGVKKYLFEYESLQKPDWGDIYPDKPDQFHVLVEISREEALLLLQRLSGVVEQIESRTLPEPELGRCGFCVFHGQCSLDGGYRS